MEVVSGSWFVIILMVILSAFFSGSEIAFLTSNRLRIELKNKQGHLWARILAGYVKHPTRFITTVLIGNNIALVLYGMFLEAELTPIFAGVLNADNDFLLLIVQTVLSTIIILVFAEFLPKVLFGAQSDTLLPSLIFPFQIFYVLLWPVMKLVNWISMKFLRKIDPRSNDNKEVLFTKVDLNHYITASVKVDSDEDSDIDTDIFKNALDFDKVKVRECMVPRNEVEAIELNDDISELHRIFIETGHSKILVYKENIDNIIGYVHQVDLFSKPDSIKSILMPIVIATESMPAQELLKKFTANRKSIAVVVDEFGGTAGIVTIEDIMEEIFGEIEDEHDVEELTEEKISDTEYKLSARLEVDYLNEAYDLNLPEGEYETLGGFIIARYESIPEKDETVKIDQFEFRILSLESARIGDVRLRIIAD